MFHPIYGHYASFFPTPSDINPVCSEIIPFIPIQVRLEHLQTNKKLLTDEQISRVKQFFIIHPSSIRVVFDDMPFAVLKLKNLTQEEHYYAVYYGQKRKLHLGGGGEGKVKLMQELDSGEWFAVKVRGNEIRNVPVECEIQMLEQVHQSVGSKFIDQKQKFYLGQKLAPGKSLCHYQLKRFSPRRLFDIALKIVAEVNHLHAQGIIHRDIKLDNLMYDLESERVTLIDYGYATNDPLELHRFLVCGTPGYIAPEIMKAKGFSKETDIFALGKTLGELFGVVYLNSSSYSVENASQELDFFDDAARPDMSSFEDSDLSIALLKLCKNICADNPSQRPTGKQIIANLQAIIASYSEQIRSQKIDAIASIHELTNCQDDFALKKLQGADLVCLYDLTHQYAKDYQRFYKNCLAKNIPLCRIIFFASQFTSEIKFLTQLPNSIERLLKIQANYFLVTDTHFEACLLSQLKSSRIQVNNFLDEYKVEESRASFCKVM